MSAIYIVHKQGSNYQTINTDVGNIELEIPSGTSIKLLSWWVTAPVAGSSIVEVGVTEWRLVLASTSAGQDFTEPIRKFNPSDPASTCTARYGGTAVTPTVIGYLERHLKREISGELRITYPIGREIVLSGPVFLGIVPDSLTSGGGSWVGMSWEESS